MKRVLSLLVVLALVLALVPAVFATTSGSGTEEDPYVVQTGSTETLEVPAQSTIYVLVTGPVTVTLAGDPTNAADWFAQAGRAPSYPDENGICTLPIGSEVFQQAMPIYNISDNAITLSITIEAPVGTMGNPDTLVLGSNTAIVDANSAGYLFNWTAEQGGVLTVTMGEDETNWYYGINNITRSKSVDNHDIAGDGVSSDSIEAYAGDVIQVAISTSDWSADEITFTASFEPSPLGAKLNPITQQLTGVPTTITTEEIAPDTTVYYSFATMAPNVLALTIEDPDAYVIYDGETYEAVDGVVTVPVQFPGMMADDPYVTIQIGNNGEEAAAFTVTVDNPAGSWENPIALDRIDVINVSLEAGNDEGFYYTWIARDDGTVTFSVGETTGEIDIVLTSDNSYAQHTLSESEDGTVSFDVSRGDVLTIQIVAEPDEYFNYPAVEATVNGSFAYAVGTQQNPDELEFGKNTAAVAEDDDDGYFFTWEAPNSGVVTITVVTEDNWFYVVNNVTAGKYGNQHCYNDNPAVASETITVSKGDVIEVNVATYDFSAGEIVIDFDFEHTHNLVYHEEVPATATENGIKAYWYCEDCDTYYAADDTEGRYPIAIKTLVILATGETEEPDTDNPKTGDAFSIALVSALVLVSGMGVAVLTVSKKKFF